MKKLFTIALTLVALATFNGLGGAQQKKRLRVPIPAAAPVDNNKKPNPPEHALIPVLPGGNFQ